MQISNFSEFFNLVQNCGLAGVQPFSNFVHVVNDYKAICGCKAQMKQSKANEANTIYMRIVGAELGQYIPHIKNRVKDTKFSFYSNGTLIKEY